ncbi:MAG: hypothetical protein M1831_004130 [Alyxoria varia]|nr:MAG: hypothetical protein M1831_004130 [Alyxoria varia]
MASGATESFKYFRQEIEHQETQTWEALKSSGTALIPFLSQDCVMIFPGSTIFSAHSKPSLNEILYTPMKPWIKYDMKDVHVVQLGQDAAQISYSVEAHRKDSAYTAMISSVWRREAGVWKMVLHQQTLPTLESDTG